MKTTVELPDRLFRRAKAVAAEQGQSLKDFFTEAVRERLERQTGGSPPSKPWEKAFGGLQELHGDNQRIQRLINAEFSTIDQEQWR